MHIYVLNYCTIKLCYFPLLQCGGHFTRLPLIAPIFLPSGRQSSYRQVARLFFRELVSTINVQKLVVDRTCLLFTRLRELKSDQRPCQRQIRARVDDFDEEYCWQTFRDRRAEFAKKSLAHKYDARNSANFLIENMRALECTTLPLGLVERANANGDLQQGAKFDGSPAANLFF